MGNTQEVMVKELHPNDTVYYSSRTSGNSVHISEDCRYVTGAHHPKEVRSLHPDISVCQHCLRNHWQKREVVEDLHKDQIVYCSATGQTGNKSKIHLEDSCRSCPDTARSVKAETLFDDAEICSFCRYDYDIDFDNSGSKYASKIRRKKLATVNEDE